MNRPAWYPRPPKGTVLTETLTLDKVLERLHKVRRSGSGYVACCPAHDDAEPSMTVGEGRDGRILCHCKAGCTFEEIATALGVPPSGLCGPDADAPKVAADRGPVRNQPKPPNESYDYTDASGAVVFRVTRWYKLVGGEWKKQFSQGKHLGGAQFAKNMDGVERVIYNLPAVRAAIASGEPVYVVEGEKDVHTLRKWGLVATTNPGGGGQWQPQYAEHLRGADVVVIPDNDRVGQAHADAVVGTARLYARSVVRVELPDLPEHGDVTDWARLGNTADNLAALVAAVSRPDPDDDPFEADFAPRPLVDLPTVSTEAMESLPALLRDLVGHYKPGIEQMVALTTALSVLSSAFPTARVAHYDRDYGLQLMFCLVARSGAGKGVLDQVARLVSGIDKRVRLDSKYDIDSWEQERANLKRGQKMDRDRPWPRTYLLPANASKSYIFRSLKENGECSCIVETEIDTFVGANEQEWGDSTDLVRKGFHHEPAGSGRVGGAGTGESVYIEETFLALALSGTWGQFDRLFGPNVDNGFFNRFCFLVSNTSHEFRSQRPSEKTRYRDTWFKRATVDVTDMWARFDQRLSPCVVWITEDGWDRIDAEFRPAFDAALASPNSARLVPFVQRSNLMAVRLIGLLTILRAGDFGADYDRTAGFDATPFDVRLGLHIASVWFAHGAALLSHLTPDENGHGPLVLLGSGSRALLSALPETFKRADADEAGEKLAEAVKPRTVKRYLQDLQKAGLLRRDGQTYHKVTVTDNVAPFTASGDSE